MGNKKTSKPVEEPKKRTITRIVGRLVLITIGAFLMALALEGFLIPNTMMDGGIMGISIILSQITGMSLPVFIIILNLPFLYFGYKMIGKKFALLTSYGITILSISTALLHHIDPFTEEMLLATLFGGGLLGVGVGLVIRYGGALDGSEILAVVLTNKLPFSVGDIVMFFNVFVFAWGGFVFGWDRAMYSVISYLIAAKALDIVVDGMSEMKSVHIISDYNQQIGEAIVSSLGRGVTYFKGQGAYSGKEKRVIYCVISRLEESKLKDIVTEIDENAFLTFSSVSEVHGGRFKKKNH